MPKVNVELRENVKAWMKKQAKASQSPEVLSSLAMAHFRIGYEPTWLTKMAVEVVGGTRRR